MNQDIKKAIAVAGSIFLILVCYYGSYLPMKKSMLFITAMQNAANLKTINDFEQNFSIPLDAPSPIGQEELVRSMTNTIANSIQNIPQNEGVAAIVNYIESYYKPIVARGRGMSFGQDIYILGALNEFAYIKTGDNKYLQASDSYFKEAVALGPKRPQGLYGLLDVYRMESNFDGFKAIAEQILSQWPNDDRTKSIYDQFMKLAPEQVKK